MLSKLCVLNSSRKRTASSTCRWKASCLSILMDMYLEIHLFASLPPRSEWQRSSKPSPPLTNSVPILTFHHCICTVQACTHPPKAQDSFQTSLQKLAVIPVLADSSCHVLCYFGQKSSSQTAKKWRRGAASKYGESRWFVEKFSTLACVRMKRTGTSAKKCSK